MIRVTYDREQCALSARGHAGQAAKGSDVVCAAVTALLLTAARYAEKAPGASVRREPGDLRVRVSPERTERARPVLDALADGLRGIAESWPEHVRFFTGEAEE